MWTRENRGRMAEIARKTKRYPTDLSDEEWGRIKPLLPKPPKRGRKVSVDLREMLNAIRYMARSGGGWRIAANEFRPVANRILVVSTVRASDAVPDHSRRVADA